MHRGKLAYYIGHARVVGAREVADGGWHHVAMTRAGNDVRLYVDGKLDKQATSEHPSAVNQRPCHPARTPSAPQQPFHSNPPASRDCCCGSYALGTWRLNVMWRALCGRLCPGADFETGRKYQSTLIGCRDNYALGKHLGSFFTGELSGQPREVVLLGDAVVVLGRGLGVVVVVAVVVDQRACVHSPTWLPTLFLCSTSGS